MEQVENFEEHSDTIISRKVTENFSVVYRYEVERNTLMVAEEKVPYETIR